MTDLTILKKKYPKIIRNKVLIRVFSSHGDDDLITVETVECKDTDEAGEIIDLIIAGHDILKKHRCDVKKELWDALEDIMPDGSEIFSNLVPYDVTDHKCYAMPDHVTVSWFNEDGREYIVAMKHPSSGKFVETLYF